MNDDDFLHAILEDPSDLPRLVYSDWLEEQGDPRAEFIRVQLELAGLTEDDPRWPPLKARETALLNPHRQVWSAPLRRLVRDCEFRRGFVATVVMDAPTFLQRSEELWRIAPVEEVRLIDAGRLVGRLAELPALARLTGLGLNGNYIDDEGIMALAGSPHVARVTRLNLGKNNLGDRGAQALAGSSHLAALQLLDLSHNHITLVGAVRLADSIQLTGLTDISLRNNIIAWDDHAMLRERFGARRCVL